jgi:hypothetical protein
MLHPNDSGLCRAAPVQLLEYRFFDRIDQDRLWVVDHAIVDRRRALLESAGAAVVFVSDSGELNPIGQLAGELLASGQTVAV